MSTNKHSFITADEVQAKIELAHIRAALLLAKSHNDIGCEIKIGQITIAVTLNSRLIPLLAMEEQEILNFLDNKPNNWE